MAEKYYYHSQRKCKYEERESQKVECEDLVEEVRATRW